MYMAWKLITTVNISSEKEDLSDFREEVHSVRRANMSYTLEYEFTDKGDEKKLAEIARENMQYLGVPSDSVNIEVVEIPD
jgi:hypothetical protein